VGARGAIAPSIFGTWLKSAGCGAEFAYFIAYGHFCAINLKP